MGDEADGWRRAWQELGDLLKRDSAARLVREDGADPIVADAMARLNNNTSEILENDPLCGRCLLRALEPTFYCWWCNVALCDRCGDEVGHCGHPDAEKLSEESAKTDGEGRRKIAKREKARRS